LKSLLLAERAIKELKARLIRTSDPEAALPPNRNEEKHEDK
jgi:hypothetical protein